LCAGPHYSSDLNFDELTWVHVNWKWGRGADKGRFESPRPYKCLLILLDGSPTMAPLHHHAIILMVRKDAETRDVQIKISGTALLKSRMDEFVVNNFQTFNSVNTLVDRTVRYVVKRYEAAEGRIDKDGFPLDVAQRIGSSTNARPKPRRRSATALLERAASV